MADATEMTVDEQIDAAQREADHLRAEVVQIRRGLSAALAREQSLSALLGMAEGVLDKADAVLKAHHAGACTDALVARLECGILRFRTVKAKDLPPAGVVS